MSIFKNEETKTGIWRKYEKGVDYANKKQIVSRTEKSWNFFLGNQWVGCETGGQKLLTQNFIKQVTQYKVATVAQNAMVAVYSDIDSQNQIDYKEMYSDLNKYWSKNWEKSKMNSIVWRILKASAIQGDSYLYWGTADTSVPPTIVDNTSIYLGDENNPSIQEQPYIIISERYSVAQAKEMARSNGISEEDIELIASDDETKNNLYNKTEVDDKVTVLLYMEKKDGVVWFGRSAKQVIIEPVTPIEQKKQTEGKAKGLTTYPVVNYIWEQAPNSARGIGEVEQLIPNQTELNKTLVRRSMAVNIGAYPRLAYDVNAISNPEDLDKVGVAIGVNGGNAQSINQMISYLNATNISNDAESLSNDLLNTTKELAGANDYALGNINPEQASGTAIIAVRDQTQVPLTEQSANLKQWVEDVSLLWIDLWITYHPNGISFLSTDEEGNEFEINIKQEELSKIKPTVKIDVSQDNQWTKMAEQQALDNLLMQKMITFEEYVEATPDNSSIPKAKLEQIIKRRAEQPQPMLDENGQSIMPQQEQMAEGQEQEPQVDAQQLYEELINEGVPQDEAKVIVEKYME